MTTTNDTAVDRLARRTVHAALDRTLTGGRVTIRDGRGTTELTSGAAHHAGPWIDTEVVVHDPAAYRRLLTERSIGLGRSYADGAWDASDLPGFLRLLTRSIQRSEDVQDRVHRVIGPARDLLARRRRRPDKHRDRENISAHYDVGNDFFERMLDDTMMYSCGIFERPDATMAEASVEKLDAICAHLDLGPSDHVLEIGTGWGGFALHAARRYGATVTTTTISARQYEHAVAAVRDAGLEDRVTVLDVDYRDLTGCYDKIVSIEMIEAIDWREHGTYFDAVDRLLADDGVAVLQAIVTDPNRFERQKHVQDFIKTEIFPDGCVPSIESLTTSAARHARLTPVALDDIGLHYAETLRRWRSNLDESEAELVTLGYDRRFVRLWRFYLAFCEAGFDERHISDVHLVLARPAWRRREAHHQRLRLLA